MIENPELIVRDSKGRLIGNKIIYGEIGGAFCRDCEQWKLKNEFVISNKTKFKIDYLCKPCSTKRIKESKKKHNYNIKMKQENWYSRKYIDHVIRTYNITEIDYLASIDKQENKCKICALKPNQSVRSKRLHVDHCHKTGKVRGLLCSRCNIALGGFNDDPELLMNAANYLLHADVKRQREAERTNLFLSELEKTLDPNDYIDR